MVYTLLHITKLKVIFFEKLQKKVLSLILKTLTKTQNKVPIHGFSMKNIVVS